MTILRRTTKTLAILSLALYGCGPSQSEVSRVQKELRSLEEKLDKYQNLLTAEDARTTTAAKSLRAVDKKLVGKPGPTDQFGECSIRFSITHTGGERVTEANIFAKVFWEDVLVVDRYVSEKFEAGLIQGERVARSIQVKRCQNRWFPFPNVEESADSTLFVASLHSPWSVEVTEAEEEKLRIQLKFAVPNRSLSDLINDGRSKFEFPVMPMFKDLHGNTHYLYNDLSELERAIAEYKAVMAKWNESGE